MQDTPIWIEGTMGDVILVDEKNADGNDVYTIIVQDDGNEWLVLLDVDTLCDIKDYQDLKDHRVCICGRYWGFSDVYEMPAMFTHRLFDETSGYLITSQAFNKE